MRHNKEYKFNLGDDADVKTVCAKLEDLGYDYKYHKLIMADGTEHQFIGFRDTLREIPDMEAALKFIADDIYLLKNFVEYEYIVEDK